MKKYKCFVAILALCILCGCTSGNLEPKVWETVQDLFNMPSVETPEATDAPEATLFGKPTDKTGNHVSIAGQVRTDELGSYLTYEGGQMHLQLQIHITDLPDKDFGIHLYIDGQPQPYCTSEDETVRYMHKFPSMNGENFTAELVFIPTTGQEGDMLEIGFILVANPDYFIDDSWAGVTMSDWSGMGLTLRMKYLADPPAQKYPELLDSMTHISQQYTDLTSYEAEMFASGEYQKEVEYGIYVNGQKSFGYLFSVADDDELEVQFELKGSDIADFGLVMYLNHEPVSIDEDDIVYVSTKNGKKVTVTAWIDLTGFDGEGVFYAVIVPRNYRTDQLGGSCLLTLLGPYYLSGAESANVLQGGN